VNKFYLTTTLPYVNADPHIGFAMEIIRADVIARYHRLSGDEVIFNTGTDEHGQKIFQKAKEQKITPQEYCDQHAENYRKLTELLNISTTNFIRTTDPHHIAAAKEFWKRCLKNGDIYKAKYQIKYCIGCELEKTESELVNGHCSIHPNLELEIIDEENYFFRWSKYEKQLLDLYKTRPDFVIPKFRLEEITKFVGGGLKDFSISRLKSKMPWGIEVPDDPEQVMYVWFDALINYISTLGWPEDEKNFADFWPAVQIAGKDNLRQQSAMWQAMLMSAKLPPSKQIYIEGFITASGQKMSKSLGNVVDPFELVKKYGVDPVRYYLLREIPAYDDGDFSESRFKEVYNADLANGIGNLTARVITLAINNNNGLVPPITADSDTHPLRVDERIYNWKNAWTDLDKALIEFRFNDGLEVVWKFIKEADKYIALNKPWELAKTDMEQFNWVIYGLLDSIHQIAWMIYPFIPETSLKIAECLRIEKLLAKNPQVKDSWTNLKTGTKIKPTAVLFPRLI
jgi:methionyl-tRNA synthetase